MRQIGYFIRQQNVAESILPTFRTLRILSGPLCLGRSISTHAVKAFALYFSTVQLIRVLGLGEMTWVSLGGIACPGASNVGDVTPAPDAAGAAGTPAADEPRPPGAFCCVEMQVAGVCVLLYPPGMVQDIVVSATASRSGC